MKSLKFIIITIVIFSSSKIIAQNTKEITQDRRQIRIDVALLERDTKELSVFKANALSFRTLLRTNNYKDAAVLKSTLVASMKREVEQTYAKVQRAKIELAQSKQEIRTDKRENRRNRRQYTGTSNDKKDIVRDLINTRDDRRDKRDDERDLEELKFRHSNQTALYNRLRVVSFSKDLSKKAKKEIYENILKKFIATMIADIDETKEELKEDQREKREDKRERRDDWRERREKF